MTQPSSLLLVDADLHGLETLTYGFEREGCKVTRTSDLSRAVQLSRTSSPTLATVMLREPTQQSLDVIGALHSARGDMPIVALGDSSLQTAARAAGAADFLRTPTFIRDVVTVGRMNTGGGDAEGLLSEYHGLFYLLRAMAATSRSCVLRLARGSRRGEIRFKDGKVVSANVLSLQHLPALHHLLLWEEAKVSIADGAVAKPSQFPLSAQEVLDECERFLRDFAHAARDLGPPNTIYQPVAEPLPAVNGMQPSQMGPLLRLFDGKRGLADVVEESPFRIFDTIRMIRRLYEGGVLVTRAQQRRATGEQQRLGRAIAAPNGAPHSMLGQWAMVPDQRGVVGDRRGPNRPLMPFGFNAGDQPGAGGDRRSPSRPMKPLLTPSQGMRQLTTPSAGLRARTTPSPALRPLATPSKGLKPVATPAPELPSLITPPPEPAPAPIPLTHKKVPSGDVAAVTGEIPAIKRRPTPAGLAELELSPTVQVKLNPDGTPVDLTPMRPPAAADGGPPTSEPPPVRAHKTPAPALTPAPMLRQKTPIPARMTPAAAFDAVEADFFAREADLYKREAVDTFDDLDSTGGGGAGGGGAGGGGHEARPKSRKRRK